MSLPPRVPDRLLGRVRRAARCRECHEPAQVHPRTLVIQRFHKPSCSVIDRGEGFRGEVVQMAGQSVASWVDALVVSLEHEYGRPEEPR